MALTKVNPAGISSSGTLVVNNLTVSGVLTAASFVGGGVVGTAGTWAVDTVGIHTTKNVGIGTTAKYGSALWVEGNSYFSGIISATRFESETAGTPTIDSPNNLNINAVNVAISTDLTVARDAYVGIGTTTGVVLTDSDGIQWRIGVTTTGSLFTTLV